MKKILVILGCVVLVASMVGTAGAAMTLIDDNFDFGLVDWATIGDAQTGVANDLLTLQGMTGNFAQLGKTQVEDLSEISQIVTAPNLTNTLNVSFNWTFNFYDFSLENDAFVSVLTPQGEISKTLVDINSGTGIATVFGFFNQTFIVPGLTNGGDVEIVFSLFEAIGSHTDSFAGIDNVSVIAAEAPAPVPIPATLLLFGSGLIGMVGLRRRKKA